jgi:hypothetical protein
MGRWQALIVLCCVAAATAAADERLVELRVEYQRLVAGPSVVRVPQGTELELRWTVDRPMALHLHGYDIEIEAAPGAPAAMRLTARATGRFPVEIHAGERGHGRPLLYIEIVPR